MPQTRFVLSKALQMGLKPIVVLNKIDRPHADPDRVLNETFDLFVELGANDEQLDFMHCYASAIEGYAMREIDESSDSLAPLLDLILEGCPSPEGDSSGPFLMQATSVAFDDYLGKQAVGRIQQGTIQKNASVRLMRPDGSSSRHNITRLEGHLGLAKIELDEAGVGDIVCISGLPEVAIGDTVGGLEIDSPLPPIDIEAPTVSVDITINDGPFAGRSGKHVTLNKIKDRLLREKRANVSYDICEKDERTMTLQGRGELHLAVLLEAMRRESYEFCVAKPEVIIKEVDGVKQEPIALAHVSVPEEYSGTVIEQLASRKGEMQTLHTDAHGITSLEYHIPVRGLVGYRNEFLTSTKGLGILTSTFDHYGPWKGDIIGRRRGTLVSMNQGKATGYSCFNLEDRGELFCAPGDEVYEGMVVGENSRENDLVVNITKGKQLTNVRASGSDENVLLSPPRQFTLEQAIGYIDDDELAEVTPDSIRLRKRHLTEVERNRNKRK
jgi:GTP-binding protein